MPESEKARLYNAIDAFLDECVDFVNIDQMLDRYEELREEIWCPDGGHEIIPDHCGLPEHAFCRFCGVRKDTLDKRE